MTESCGPQNTITVIFCGTKAGLKKFFCTKPKNVIKSQLEELVLRVHITKHPQQYFLGTRHLLYLFTGSAEIVIFTKISFSTSKPLNNIGW